MSSTGFYSTNKGFENKKMDDVVVKKMLNKDEGAKQIT